MRNLARQLAVLAVFWASAAAAEGFETKAAQAYVIEAESGTVLLAKAADTPVQPASLTKLMTAEVVFDALASGKLSMNDSFKVSEHAWRTGGAPSRTATMFAQLNSQVRVEDLLKGVIVASANDGSIALAEGMFGSEEKFTEQMNRRAQIIGLAASSFRNPTGTVADGQNVTMRDLVRLSQYLHSTYPDYYKFYALPEFEWNKIKQRNKNPLLNIPGVDGLAAGGAQETGGFTFVGAAQRGEQRLYLALGGMSSDRERVAEARRLIEWGMTAFDRAPLFPRDAVIGQARVYGGEKPTVGLRAHGAVSIFMAEEDKDKLSAQIVYDGPAPAPITAGQRIGALKIWVGATLTQETPLYAAEDVGLGSVPSRARNALGELAFGWLR